MPEVLNNTLLRDGPHVCDGDPTGLHHRLGVFAVALVSPLCDGHYDEVPWALVYQNKPYDSLIRDYKLVSPHMLPSLKRHMYDFLGRH